MNGRSQVKAVKEATASAPQSVMDAASDVADVVVDVGKRASRVARDAGERASVAAETAYGAGSDVAAMVEGVVRQNPWASLLVAMAAGYGFACIVKQQRR